MAKDSTPACDIIIVTCNRLDDTARCLESVEKNTAGAIPYRYIFVDNNSTDGTLEYLRKFGGSVLVENKKDLGFAGAMNRGLERVRAKYAVWLSCDTVVTPGWLDALVGHLEADPGMGAAGPMCNTAGTLQHDYSYDAGTEPGEISEYGKNFRLKNRGRTAEYHRIGGFCMVMRSKLIPKIGLLDARLGSGPLCDEDYCRRMRGTGYGILIAGDVFVYGAAGGAPPHPAPADPDSSPPFLEQKDRDYFLRKWVRPDGRRTRTPKNPLVSVIMATKDRETTIPAAIRSVLSQTYRNFELIIVNDGGRDIKPIIRGFNDPRIRYVRLQKHGGKSRANNHAIGRAKGDVIAYLDDDDRWHQDHLQATVGELVKFESRMFVYADYVKVECLVNLNGTQLPVKKELMKMGNARYDSVDQGNFIPNFSMVHKKSLFEAERYDEELDFWEDWDLIRRFSKHAYFVRVPEATGEYWINTHGSTRNSSRMLDKNRDAVARYITTKYSPTKNRVLLDLYSADKLAKSSEWAHAVGIYKGILETDPEYIPALEGYANCLYNLQQYRQCSEALDQLIKRDLNNYEMYMLYSSALIKTGDYEKAKTWLEFALVINPDVGGLILLQECYAGMRKKNSSEFIKSQIQKKQARDSLESDQPLTTDELNRQVSDLEGEKTRLAGQVSDLEGEKTRLAGQVSDLEGERTDLAGKVSELETEKTRLAGQVSELETDKAGLQADKTGLTGKVSELETEKTNLAGRVSDLEEERTGLTGRVSELETDRADLTGRISELETDRADLTGRISELETERTGLAGKVSELETEKTRLAGQVSELETDRAILETEKTNLAGQVSGLETDKADLQADKADLQADKTGLTGKVSELETEKTNLAGRVSDLEEERTGLAGQVSELEAEKTRLTGRVSGLEEERTGLTGRVSELEADRADLTGRISELETEKTRLAERVAGQQKDLESIKSGIGFKIIRSYGSRIDRLKKAGGARDKPPNRQNLSETAEPLYVLLSVYARRTDLQSRFPEAKKGQLSGLVGWAAGVVTRSFADTEYGLLLPHAPWYTQQTQKPGPGKGAGEPSRLSGMRQIAAASLDTIKKEGAKSYLDHIRTKVRKREFKIIPYGHAPPIPAGEAHPQKKRAAPGRPVGGSFEELLPALHKNQISLFGFAPKISVILPTYNSQKIWLERAIESVIDQEYGNWELCIVDDASTESHVGDVLDAYGMLDSRIRVRHLPQNLGIAAASNEAIRMSTGDYTTFLDHDDELAPDALFEVAKRLNMDRDLDIIYSDDAKKDESDRVYDHQFKPDWSPELLLSYSYFSHLVVYKKRVIDGLGGLQSSREPSQDYDLMLRATETTDKIHHIPKILYYWRSLKTSTAKSVRTKPHSIEAGRLAVGDALARRKIPGDAAVPDYAKGKNGVYKINFKLKDTPRVSIIIPTRDRQELLAKAVDSIENSTAYPDYEILIVDAGSKDPQTLDYLKRSGHTVLRIPSERFNFSRANNIAAAKASGEYLLLMNNDVEAATPALIEEMVGYLESDPKIGVVGAKLLYPDQRVQHGGVVLGLNDGLSGHANKLIPGGDPGYLMYGHVARNYSAVTAALLMIRKRVYLEVGGMDEQNLGLSYNDVDLCLKAVKAGYRVVYNPYALAYHHEGATKGRGEGVDDKREEDFFRTKWHGSIKRDPYYNPNLSLADERFRIRDRIPGPAILFVTHNLNFEGGPISMSLLARGFQEKDYRVAVLSPRDGPLRDFYMLGDIEVIVEPEFFLHPETMAGFAGGFDLVYANTIMSHPAVRASKLSGVPAVWCIRESERDHYRGEGADFGQFEAADRVLFVADATRRIYSDLERGGNFAVIPNGVDLAGIDSFKTFNPKADLRRKHGLPAGAVIVTVVGTVAERKGQHVFVESALELCGRDKNLHFVVVGCRDGPYLERVKKLARGNPEQIHLVPETGDVYDYYGISDLFVCTSFIESFPRVILEAMAFELPIVSTDVFGIPEQITDGVHGILIRPGDPGLLAEKIGYLLKNPGVAKTYAKNGYLKAKKEYEMGRIVDRHESFFGSILGDPPRR